MYCKTILALKAVLSFTKIYCLPFVVSSNKTMRALHVHIHINYTTFHTDNPTTRDLPQFLPKLGKM